MNLSRRHFLGRSAGVAIASAVSARWVDAEEISEGSKVIARFSVASDLHYGQPNTPFEKMAGELIGWINQEKKNKHLDAFFFNGDLSNDSSAALLELRDNHLSKLLVPYHAVKGNHDFVDGKAGSPTESWESLWGYPSNHSIKIGDFAFIMADTTAPAKSDVYLAADIDWLRGQLEKYRDAPAIFVMIHIQQRRQGVEGWPQHGVHDDEEVPKAEAVMALLESTPNVRAIFHGHNHNETGVYVSGEKRYFFDSHAGGSWGAKRGYRIVEIYDDYKMLTYQMDAQDNIVSNRHEVPG